VVNREKVVLILAAVIAMIAPLARLRADDWPQFRGPEGRGTTDAKNLAPVDANGLAVRWKTPIPGDSVSSPIIVGDRVFLTTSYPEERHPLDQAAAFLLLGHAGLILIRAVLLTRSILGANADWRRAALGVFSALVVALVVAVLAKPTWFWRFPDPWTGTILADADLEFVETYYLRPVIVLEAVIDLRTADSSC